MDSFTKTIPIADLPVGGLKKIAVNGFNIALANVDGKVYAVDDICTHAQCSLGGAGFLTGLILTCGCHGGEFDVTTGKVLKMPPVADLKTYEVNVAEDFIYLKI